MPGLHEMNANLQMNSECMECLIKTRSTLNFFLPFSLCAVHNTRCPHPSLSTTEKEQSVSMQHFFFFFLQALAKQT